MKLYLSINPWLNGGSVTVTMLIASDISKEPEFGNIPPLFVKNISDTLYICLHDLKIPLVMTFGSYDLIKLDA